MTEFQEIRKLFDVWDNSFGFSQEEIAGCERRLGVKLPETLGQYYLQLGKNEQINQTQDSLVLPSELKIGENGFVVFYNENQSVWQAGFKFTDCSLDNPPVYLTYDGKTWEKESPQTSAFLISIAHLQAIFAFPYNANCAGIKSEKETVVRRNWKKADSAVSIWGIEFFQNDMQELLALMKSENQFDVFIAAKTEERFKDLNKKLGIDWDYNSLED